MKRIIFLTMLSCFMQTRLRPVSNQHLAIADTQVRKSIRRLTRMQLMLRNTKAMVDKYVGFIKRVQGDEAKAQQLLAGAQSKLQAQSEVFAIRVPKTLEELEAISNELGKLLRSELPEEVKQIKGKDNEQLKSMIQTLKKGGSIDGVLANLLRSVIKIRGMRATA